MRTGVLEERLIEKAGEAAYYKTWVSVFVRVMRLQASPWRDALLRRLAERAAAKIEGLTEPADHEKDEPK